MTTSIQETAGP